MIWYSLLNKQGGGHEIHLPLDDMIPFVPAFVVFYVIWYFYIVFALVWTLVKSKRDFIHMSLLIFITLFSSMIICTAYPSYHTMRPEITGKEDFFTWIVSLIYASDNPCCIFPSMHVGVAVAITIGLWFAESMKGKTWQKILFTIYCVLVSLSTVFIKQHSIADVFLGLVMPIPASLLVYFVIWPKKRWTVGIIDPRENATLVNVEESSDLTAKTNLPPQQPPKL